MECPKCNHKMVRQDSEMGQYKCPNCNYEGICQRCLSAPVHPHRKWQLCLDCICDILDENGSIEMKAKWKVKANDPKNAGCMC